MRVFPHPYQDFTWNKLWVMNRASGLPWIRFDTQVLELPEIEAVELGADVEFEGRPAKQKLMMFHDRDGVPVLSYWIPSRREEDDKLGWEEITITFHGWRTGKGGFSVNGPIWIPQEPTFRTVVGCFVLMVIAGVVLTMVFGAILHVR